MEPPGAVGQPGALRPEQLDFHSAPRRRSFPRVVGFRHPLGRQMLKCVGMPHPPAPLPRALADEFSTSHACAEGVTRARLRAQDLTSPYYRVRRRASVDRRAAEEAASDHEPYAQFRTLRRKILNNMRAYATVMPEGSFYCGRTAAIAYGIWIDHPSDDLEVSVFSPGRAPRARGVKGRRVAPHLATTRMLDGLMMSSPATTWAMLGRDLSMRELVGVGDAFVRVPRDRFGRQHPDEAIITTSQLAAAVDAGSRPGSGTKLATALELIRVGSSSPLETDFRLDAAAGGLPEASLDMEVYDEHGRLIGISEFVYEQLRVVVEIEGDHHRTTRKQWNRDIDKYHAYAAAGFEVVRLTSAHIRGAYPTAVELVRAALRRHGWSG